jgi:voltage-dependent calcium channel R type alpha-1E
MCLKIFVYGFVLTGEDAYLRSGWNILDCLIVLSALVGLNPNSSKGLKALKTLRILRVLRPLKLAAKNKGLKVAITALFQSLPNIFNLQLIVLFFLFLFGILHTTLFAGKMWYCSTDHLTLSYE